jgi:non-heme chloroperoxidase
MSHITVGHENSVEINLHYTDRGTGQPVVLIHGYPLDGASWEKQEDRLLDAGYRVITYDRRGFGASSKPATGYDYDTFADDLAALIERLDLRGVTLVGHSIGGGVIVRYLTRHGAGRVVLLAPSTPFLLKTEDNPDGVDTAAFELVRAAFARDFPKWLADNARPFVVAETSPEMVQWVQGLMLQCSLKAAIDLNRAQVATDFRPELPGVTVPTLVIHGDVDVSAPLELTGRRTAALIPGARLTVYEGAPHGLMFTHTDRLNADLLAFVGEGAPAEDALAAAVG